MGEWGDGYQLGVVEFYGVSLELWILWGLDVAHVDGFEVARGSGDEEYDLEQVLCAVFM